VPFAVVYGISGNTRAYWDIANARRELGYAPEDDAERYADEILSAAR
jgi:uronate dehydrogenase